MFSVDEALTMDEIEQGWYVIGALKLARFRKLAMGALGLFFLERR